MMTDEQKELLALCRKAVVDANNAMKRKPPLVALAELHLRTALSACTTLVNRLRGERNPNE